MKKKENITSILDKSVKTKVYNIYYFNVFYSIFYLYFLFMQVTLRSQNYNFCSKTRCSKCSIKCNYKMEKIKSLKHKDVRIELKRHGHPTFRLINKKKNNLSQMKHELFEHYKKSHLEVKLINL